MVASLNTCLGCYDELLPAFGIFPPESSPYTVTVAYLWTACFCIRRDSPCYTVKISPLFHSLRYSLVKSLCSPILQARQCCEIQAPTGPPLVCPHPEHLFSGGHRQDFSSVSLHISLEQGFPKWGLSTPSEASGSLSRDLHSQTIFIIKQRPSLCIITRMLVFCSFLPS